MTDDAPETTPANAPGREETDESLRVERENADQVLAQQQAVDHEADLVVHRAREDADAVLAVARVKADQRLEETSPAGTADAAERVIEKERLVEDEALRDERSTADDRLRREREEYARALAQLLAIERNKTDRFLFVERERADDDISKRDDFLGMVSHDLRDLLGGIVLSGAVLAQRGVANHDEVILDATGRIQRYAARMNRLIGDLLDVASIDAGKFEMVVATGDGAALITEAIDVFQAAASSKGVTLVMEPMAEPIQGAFDHDRMLQVLANLITNAIKFTPGGGHISLRCDRHGDELRICVSDSGRGIPAGRLTDVFERFWQVGLNERRGLGLGLYISRCIVEAHGGRIWAESEPDKGSRFYVTLPAAE